MAVVNTRTQDVATPYNPTSSSQIAVTLPKAVSQINNNAQDTTVNISGQAMLLSRLFDTANVNVDIPVLSSGTTNTGNFYGFLTKDDRKMLDSAYQYTSANGIDPRYVDDLAFDLAIYRQCPDAKNGAIGDLAGHKLTFSFGANDATVANRILNSTAINNQTSIDRGFLNRALNPATGPGHAVNFDFLEKMISVFSTSSSSVPAASVNDSMPSFTSYTPPENDFITHVSAEVVWAPPPEADYTSIDGVGHWRTPELAAAASHGGSGNNSGINLTSYPAASNKNTTLEVINNLLGFSDKNRKK